MGLTCFMWRVLLLLMQAGGARGPGAVVRGRPLRPGPRFTGVHYLCQGEVGLKHSAAWIPCRPLAHQGLLRMCACARDRQVASRELEVELYILRSTCASLEGAGGRTTVLTLETVPTSKHITRRPGHRHKLLDVFRQRRPQGETCECTACTELEWWAR
jgi:hypothetical protein